MPKKIPLPSFPEGMPSYEAALEDSQAWLILVDWHHSRFAQKGARSLPSEIKAQHAALFWLYAEVHRRGGWLRTTGLGDWEAIDLLLEMSNTKEVYERYLLAFEITYDPATAYTCRDEESRVEVKEIRPELLFSVPVVHPPKSGTIGLRFWQTFVEQEIALLREFDKIFELDHSCFAVERLMEEYPNFEVDVLTQDRAARFCKNTVNKEKRPLKQYARKVLDEIQGKADPNSAVEFAVNIDIDSWRPQVDELRQKLPKRLLWCSEDDALGDVRQHIKGMTLPQLYIKGKGCWTGGHQENLRFCSININHGPGDCEWWAMDTTCTDAFRAKVLQTFQCDIFYQETLWWPDENWCLANGFKLYYVLQRPGDIVFVGVGTLHWVRSMNPTVNSSWNIGLKTYKQFKAAFDRFAVNDTINYKTIVPVHNLALDLLNFELPNLPKSLIVLLQEHVN